MRRLATTFAVLTVLVGAALASLVLTPRPAAATVARERGGIEVIEVAGYLDPVLVDFVERAISRAERRGAVALVIQLDSPGAVVSRPRMDRLVRRIERSGVPVGVWVGPSRSEAAGEAARLVTAAQYVGLSDSTVELAGRRVGPAEASREGIADFPAETLGDFIVNLPDVESREVRQGEQIRREPVTPSRFASLSPLDELMHTVASPPVAYLLFAVGMALLVFELYTAGVGIAGVVGAGCLVLAFYGLSVLPATGVGMALLVVSMFSHAVDIQTGVRRLWTLIGTVLFVLGSLVFYDGVSLSWVTLLITIVGVTLFMVVGVPTMARTRFSARSIDREWLAGEQGTARTAIDGAGVAVIRGAPWRARIVQGSPLAPGDQLRVVRIDGLVLEVEPLGGTASGDVAGRAQGNGGRA